MLSSCDRQAWLPRGTDLTSRTRDQTCVPCIGKWIFNHWTTREVPYPALLNQQQWLMNFPTSLSPGKSNGNLIYFPPESDLMQRIFLAPKKPQRFKTGFSVLSCDAFIKFYIYEDPANHWELFSFITRGGRRALKTSREQALSANRGQTRRENSEPRIHAAAAPGRPLQASLLPREQAKASWPQLFWRREKQQNPPAFASCLFPFC